MNVRNGKPREVFAVARLVLPHRQGVKAFAPGRNGSRMKWPSVESVSFQHQIVCFRRHDFRIIPSRMDMFPYCKTYFSRNEMWSSWVCSIDNPCPKIKCKHWNRFRSEIHHPQGPPKPCQPPSLPSAKSSKSYNTKTFSKIPSSPESLWSFHQRRSLPAR